MGIGGNSSKSQKNSLAERARRAAGRDPEREKGPVSGAFGKHGRLNARLNSHPRVGNGGGGGSTSKSDYTAVGPSKRKARKRKA